MGVLENTRSLGDFKFKPFGVTPEPEVREKLLKGSPRPIPCLIFLNHLTMIQAQSIRTLS